MAIDFKSDLFNSDEKEKVSLHMPKDMVEFLDDLAALYKFNDQSKAIRWCIEQIAKEAFEREAVKPRKRKIA